MASYNEYTQPRDPATGQFVSRQDEDIQGEINQAAEAQTQRNIPESVANRFAGKSVDDVLESYAQLERTLGRQGEEMGYLRRQQEQLMEMQLQYARNPVADTAKPVEPITADDLYNNPDEAISRVVESRAKSQLEPIQRELQELRMERTKANLEKRFPSWESEVRSEAFRQWVEASDFRRRMAQAGDSGDIGAATDLLSDWYSRQERQQEQEKQEVREQQLNDAALIEGSPAPVQSDVTFDREKLMELRAAAHEGDRKAQDWLHKNADAIRLAYQEGRVT